MIWGLACWATSITLYIKRVGTFRVSKVIYGFAGKSVFHVYIGHCRSIQKDDDVESVTWGNDDGWQKLSRERKIPKV